MLSKLICAAALATGAAVQGHSLHTRDVGYPSVNRDGGGGHGHSSSSSSSSSGSSYGAPAASYNAPAPAQSYGAPAPSYSAPAPSYGAPAPSYGAPEQSYSAPSQSYGTDTYGGYDDGGKLDLTSILIPLLALLGLSLLFPTYVSLTTIKRKKRSDDEEDVNALTDVVERVNDIYMAVVESEECMQRIACEVGGLAEDVGIRENSLTQMAESFVPTKYKSYYNQFQSGKNCHKIKCGSIF